MVDEEVLEETLPIRQDAIAEEVFVERYNARKVSLTAIWALALYGGVATLGYVYASNKTPVTRWVKIDQLGRATPLRYSDLDFTPDTAMARTYLGDWATFRYARLRAGVLKTFPKNYLFLDEKYGEQIQRRDMMENVVASVVAGHTPENDANVTVNIQSWGKQSVGGRVLASGHAEIVVVKRFATQEGTVRLEGWTIEVTFFLNPGQVFKQSESHPEYQTINPLGLTITQFVENRAMVDPVPAQQ